MPVLFLLTDEVIAPIVPSRFTYFLLRNVACRLLLLLRGGGGTARFVTYKLDYITFRRHTDSNMFSFKFDENLT